MFLMVDLVGVVFFELAVSVAGDALKDNGNVCAKLIDKKKLSIRI